MKIFFLILGPACQVHGSERTGFVCVSRRPFSALCKCACFLPSDRWKKGGNVQRACPPGSRAKMLGGLPIAHQGPCPPPPRPTLPLRLQGALLKRHVADRIFRGTAWQVDTEPRKAQDYAAVGQLALLPRLSEGRVTDRRGALAPGDGRGPQRDLQAGPFLSLGGRMLGSG